MNNVLLEYLNTTEKVFNAIIFNQEKLNFNLDLSQRRGGYLTIAHPDDGILLVSRICLPDLIKQERYLFFSQKKAKELSDKGNSYTTSYQTRNLEEEKYGGAIYINHYILSFSGLPELVEEALLLTVELIICASVHRKILKDNIIENIYNKRKNKEGLKYFLGLSQYYYDHLFD